MQQEEKVSRQIPKYYIIIIYILHLLTFVQLSCSEYVRGRQL